MGEVLASDVKAILVDTSPELCMYYEQINTAANALYTRIQIAIDSVKLEVKCSLEERVILSLNHALQKFATDLKSAYEQFESIDLETQSQKDTEALKEVGTQEGVESHVRSVTKKRVGTQKSQKEINGGKISISCLKNDNSSAENSDTEANEYCDADNVSTDTYNSDDNSESHIDCGRASPEKKEASLRPNMFKLMTQNSIENAKNLGIKQDQTCSHEYTDCRKVFVNDGEYKHFYKEGLGQRSLLSKCNICEELCSSSSDMLRHIEKMHNESVDLGQDQSKTKCPGCEKQFSTPSNMRKHVKQKHYEIYTSQLEQRNSLKEKRVRAKAKRSRMIHVSISHEDAVVEDENTEHTHSGKKMKTESNELKCGSDTKALAKKKGKYCPICEKVFSTTGNLHKHIRQKYSFFIDPNNSLFTDRKLFSLGPAKKPRNASIECRMCSGKFWTVIELLQHAKYDHYDKLHQRPSSSINENAKIVITEKGKASFVCLICGRSFSTHGNFRKHMRTKHINEEISQWCSICRVHFKNLPRYQQHMSTRHSVAVEAEIVCKICQATFKNTNEFTDHAKAHVSEKPSGSLACDMCNRMFTIPEVLKNHYIIAHKQPSKWYCARCDLYFVSQFKLTLHKGRKHGGKKEYCCEFCAREFFTHDSLKAHVVARHGVKTDFQCNICDRYFSLPSQLAKHKIDRHEEVKKDYLCADCGKSFSTPALLKQHSQKHSMRLPYKCPFCPCTFRWPSSLDCHVRAKHGQGQGFKCEHCDAIFRTRNALRYHIKRRHENNNEAYQCMKCGVECSMKSSMSRHLKRKHDVRLALDETYRVISASAMSTSKIRAKRAPAATQPSLPVVSNTVVSDAFQRNEPIITMAENEFMCNRPEVIHHPDVSYSVHSGQYGMSMPAQSSMSFPSEQQQQPDTGPTFPLLSNLMMF